MKRTAYRTAGRAALGVLLVLLALGILLPTLLTLTASFMPQRELEHHYGAALDTGTANDAALALYPQHPTTEQYVTLLLQTPHYLLRFFNSLALTVPITLGQLVLSCLSAYSLYRCRNRFRRGVYVLYVLLMLLPYQVTLLPHYLVTKSLGLLGTRWAVVLSGVVSPFAVFLLFRHMRQIPFAQVEAAMLDGAGEWRIFTRIFLPQCRPTLWAVSMLIFAEYWGMVEQPLVLLDAPETYPLSIFLSQMDHREAGVAFAAAVLFLLPPLVLFLFGQRHFAVGFGVAEQPFPHTRQRRGLRIGAAVCAGVVGITLWGITRKAVSVNPHFTPQVTVTTADTAEIEGVIYSRVLPRDAVHVDDYGHYVMSVIEQEKDGIPVCRVDYQAVTVVAETTDMIALTEQGNWSTVILTFDRLPAENSFVYVKTAPGP